MWPLSTQAYACIVACLSVNKTLKDPLLFEFVDVAVQPRLRMLSSPLAIGITLLTQSMPRHGARIYGWLCICFGVMWFACGIALAFHKHVRVAVIANFVAMEAFSSTAVYNFWYLFNITMSPTPSMCHKLNIVGQVAALLIYGLLMATPVAHLELCLSGLLGLVTGCTVLHFPEYEEKTHTAVSTNEDVESAPPESRRNENSRRKQYVLFGCIVLASILQNAFKASVDYSVKVQANIISSDTAGFVAILETSGFLTVIVGVMLSFLPVLGGCMLCGIVTAPLVFAFVAVQLPVCSTPECLMAVMCALKAGDTAIIPPVREIMYIGIDEGFRKHVKLVGDTYGSWLGKACGIMLTMYALNSTTTHVLICTSFSAAYMMLWMLARRS